MTAVRNPQLVHVLDKLKYIENYGTGIRRIYEAYRKTGKSPEFDVRPNSFKVRQLLVCNIPNFARLFVMTSASICACNPTKLRA